MKTATIERYAIYGTPYHAVNLIYRAEILWQEIDRFQWIDRHGLNEPLYGLARVATLPEFGFTHWRFTGDWEKRTKPRGGKIRKQGEF